MIVVLQSECCVTPNTQALSAQGLHALPNAWFAMLFATTGFHWVEYRIVVPPVEALSIQSMHGDWEGMNSWTLLVFSDDRIKIFNQLLS